MKTTILTIIGGLLVLLHSGCASYNVLTPEARSEVQSIYIKCEHKPYFTYSTMGITIFGNTQDKIPAEDVLTDFMAYIADDLGQKGIEVVTAESQASHVLEVFPVRNADIPGDIFGIGMFAVPNKDGTRSLSLKINLGLHLIKSRGYSRIRTLSTDQVEPTKVNIASSKWAELPKADQELVLKHFQEALKKVWDEAKLLEVKSLIQ